LDGGATPSSCLGAAVVPMTMAVSPSPSRHRSQARKRRLQRNGSASQRCGGGWPTTCYAVRRPVRLSTCPVSNVSGVHVSVVACPVTGVAVSGLRASGVRASHVRVRLVGAVAGSWSELVAGADCSWVGQERPAADRRAGSGGDHGSGWVSAGLAQQSAGVAWSGLPSRGWKRGDTPWFPLGPGGLGPLMGGIGWRRSRRLARTGCGDYAQWSSREARGPSRPVFRALPVPLRPERAAAARPQHAMSAADDAPTTL
jgi:hypothetical protein